MDTDKKIKKVYNGDVSRLTTYTDGNMRLDTKLYDIEVHCQNELLAIELRSFLTILGLVDATKGINKESAKNSFIRTLYSAKNNTDLEEITDFLYDVENFCDSDIINDLINELQVEVIILGDRILAMSNEERQQKRNELDTRKSKSKTNTKNSYFDSIIQKKELLDMKADELRNQALKNPEDYFDLARDYDDLVMDLNQLVKNGQVSESDIEELKRTTQVQSNNLKSSATRLEEIVNSFQI